MTHCFTGGYLNNNFKPNLFKGQPRCAKADSIVFNETRGYVWGNLGAHEQCTNSDGQISGMV